MSAWTAVAVGFGCSAAWLHAPRPRIAELGGDLPGDLSRGLPGAGRSSAGPRDWAAAPATRLLTSAAAGLIGVVLVSGLAGWVLAALLAGGVHRWLGRLGARADAALAGDLRRQLPLSAELIAAALSAGATTPAAVALAARATGPPVGELLDAVATAFQLGAIAEEAWLPVLRRPELSALGRLAVRSAASGSTLADACRELAVQAREALVVEAQVAVKRAGILSVLPLALCFLPAFVLVGVVPIVAGLLGSLSF